MKITLKEIAYRAGVSITTVSHIINHTRYVKPETVEKVMQIIRETGYHNKNKARDCEMSVLLVPTLDNPFYAQLADCLNQKLIKVGQTLSIFATDGTEEQEYMIFQKILPKISFSALYLATDLHDEQALKSIYKRNIQTIHLRKFYGSSTKLAVYYDTEQVYEQAVQSLLEHGHKKILFLFSGVTSHFEAEQKLTGCKKALGINKIPEWDWLVCRDSKKQSIQNFLTMHLCETNAATAVLCGSPQDTFAAMDFFKARHLDVPNKVSIIGTLDSKTQMEIYPGLSAIIEMPEPLAQAAVNITNKSNKNLTEFACCPQFLIKESIRTILRGQDGSLAKDPEILELTEYEILEIQRRGYSICVSFHDANSDLTKMHEMGIRNMCNKLHIAVNQITHAGYNPALQIQQIEDMLIDAPDAIIVLPVNDVKIRSAIRRIVQTKTKLILLSNFTKGISRESYVTYVGDNDLESGRIVGQLLGSHFRNCKSANIALFPYAIEAFSSNQRDRMVERILRERFSHLHIAARVPWHTISGVYNIAKATLLKYPEINAIYTTFEQPARIILQVMRELGREDIVIATADLGIDIALELAQHHSILGLAAQRPYEQGKAAVMAAANALFGRKVPSYIHVQPVAVTRKNILYVWKEIMKTKIPPQLKGML